jgi:hypothetical protein
MVNEGESALKRVREILSTVKHLAAEYYRLTGKPLGVIGEVPAPLRHLSWRSHESSAYQSDPVAVLRPVLACKVVPKPSSSGTQEQRCCASRNQRLRSVRNVRLLEQRD